MISSETYLIAVALRVKNIYFMVLWFDFMISFFITCFFLYSLITKRKSTLKEWGQPVEGCGTYDSLVPLKTTRFYTPFFQLKSFSFHFIFSRLFFDSFSSLFLCFTIFFSYQPSSYVSHSRQRISREWYPMQRSGNISFICRTSTL